MDMVKGEMARRWANKTFSMLRMRLRRFYGIGVSHWIVHRIKTLPRYDKVRLGIYVMMRRNWDLDDGVSALRWVSFLGGDLHAMVITSMNIFTPNDVAERLEHWNYQYQFEKIWGREMRIKMERYISLLQRRRRRHQQRVSS